MTTFWPLHIELNAEGGWGQSSCKLHHCKDACCSGENKEGVIGIWRTMYLAFCKDAWCSGENKDGLFSIWGFLYLAHTMYLRFCKDACCSGAMSVFGICEFGYLAHTMYLMFVRASQEKTFSFNSDHHWYPYFHFHLLLYKMFTLSLSLAALDALAALACKAIEKTYAFTYTLNQK